MLILRRKTLVIKYFYCLILLSFSLPQRAYQRQICEEPNRGKTLIIILWSTRVAPAIKKITQQKKKIMMISCGGCDYMQMKRKKN